MNGDVGAIGVGTTEGCLRDCPILVVDDAEFNRTIIGAMLEDAGYRDIRYACSGFEALDAVEANPPDLVLLDIMMPGMDGFEVCRRIRANFGNADLPVLVQTALSSIDDRNRAFESGATDLVSKPIERHEFLARVRIHLENRVLIRRQRAYRERVEGELAIAKGMFDHLSPTPLQCEWIRQTTGTAVRSCARLSSRLGGAAWGVVPLAQQGRVGVYMLDVAGQGLAAALNAFRLHTLIHELKDLGDMPAALLTALNARAAALFDAGDRAGLLFGVLDAHAATFTYAAAGALAPRLARPGADRLIDGERGGEEIGAGGDTIYRSRRLDIAPGDVLTLENRLLDGDYLGSDPIAAAALDAANGDAAFDRLRADIDDLPGEAFDDDYLAVWLDRSASDDAVLAEGA